MKQLRFVWLVIALSTFPGCFKFGTQLEERVSSRLVMGQYDQGTLLQKTQQTVIRIGDREYVNSVLNNVFGPVASGAVRDNILRKAPLFGGPCDAMSEGAKSDPTCDFSDINAATVPVVTSAREALRTQACDQVVQNDDAIRYAAAQARDVEDGSFIASDRPQESDLRAAYDLFMPGRAPSPDVLRSLKTDVVEGSQKAGLSSTDSWRFLFLTLCLSPQWQQL